MCQVLLKAKEIVVNKSACFLEATVLRASGEYKRRKWILKTFIFIQKQYHN